MPPAWYQTMFAHPEGIDAYFLQMSGGRENIEWEVFGPHELMSLQSKIALDTMPQDQVVAGIRAAAVAKGVPVDAFPRWIWVFNQAGSVRGVQPALTEDVLLGAATIEPQITIHEMLHTYGGGLYHADRYIDGQLIEYASPFCPMGTGSIARSYPNPALTITGTGFSHDTTGPGMSAPSLASAGWLDSASNVLDLRSQHINAGIVTLYVNQGAPQVGSTQAIAITAGPHPMSTIALPQLWIEYRIPIGFDRHIDRPVSSSEIDLPPQGAVLLHEVRYAGAGNWHSVLVEWIPATTGERINLAPLPFDFVVIEANLDHSRIHLKINRRPWRRWKSIGTKPEFYVQVPVAAIARKPSIVDLFKVDRDGVLQSNTLWQDPVGSRWLGWFPIHPEVEIHYDAHITALARQPDHIDLFMTDESGQVHWCWWHGDPLHWRPWIAIHPSRTFRQWRPVVAVSRDADHIDLFVMDRDGSIWTSGWNTGRGLWQEWVPLHHPTRFSHRASLTALAQRADHLDIFAINALGEVWSCWWHADIHHWRPWFSIHPAETFPDAQAVAAISRIPEHIDLFVIGRNGAVWSTWWHVATDTAGWRPWFPIHPETTFGTDAQVTALSRGPDCIDLFVTDRDGVVWTCAWHADPDGWRPWLRLTDAPEFRQEPPVVALARDSDQIELFKTAEAGMLWSTRWSPT
jgi:hypothetical protein